MPVYYTKYKEGLRRGGLTPACGFAHMPIMAEDVVRKLRWYATILQYCQELQSKISYLSEKEKKQLISPEYYVVYTSKKFDPNN